MSLISSTALALGGPLIGALIRALTGGGRWSLVSLDPQVPFEVVGRFPIRDGVDVSTDAAYAVSQGIGDQGELVQFLSGRSDRVSFTIEVHDTGLKASLSGITLSLGVDDLKSEIEQIQALARKHPTLRRPVRVRFYWGSEFYRDCFVQSVRTRIARISRLTGRIKEAYLTLALIEAPEMYLEETDPSAPEPESVEVVAEAGDTFELIASRAYQDPNLGVQLRHRHWDIYGGLLTSGARVLVVDRDHSDMRAPDFLSPALADDGSGDFATAYRAHVAARSTSCVVPS